MPLIDMVRIGGKIFSWNSIVWKIDGIRRQGFNKFSLGQARPKKLVKAAVRSGRPIGRTSGGYEPKPCKVSFLREELDWITQYLAEKDVAQGGDGTSYGSVEFDFTLQLVERAKVITIVGSQCTIDDEDEANDEGQDESITETVIQPLALTRNGLSLFESGRDLLL